MEQITNAAAQLASQFCAAGFGPGCHAVQVKLAGFDDGRPSHKIVVAVRPEWQGKLPVPAEFEGFPVIETEWD